MTDQMIGIIYLVLGSITMGTFGCIRGYKISHTFMLTLGVGFIAYSAAYLKVGS